MDKPLKEILLNTKKNKAKVITFLKGLVHRKIDIKKIDAFAKNANKTAFEKIDCLACGNCCKAMTPTFNEADIKRIARHFTMRSEEFKDTYLDYETKGKDWINKKMPCSFLNQTSNKCSIYDIRPHDCASFPHTQLDDFIHNSKMHKQNILYCPITAVVVEQMMEAVLITKTLKA